MSTLPLLQEQTIKYKTYLKRSLVDAVEAVFQNHPDDLIRDHTHVSTDMPRERAGFPSVIVRFYERTIRNAGVGHLEHILKPSGKYQPFKHYLYDGDIELAIYALSSPDRDLLADSITQIITMGDLEYYTQAFNNRIYASADIDAEWNFININSDKISGYGETQVAAPWMAEDQLVYQTSYRVGIFGEFYSRVLDTEYGLVEHVPFYPYRGADLGGPDPIPTGDPADQSEWISLDTPVDGSNQGALQGNL